MKNFSDLTEQELLALAIALEEEDNRTYSDFAEGLRDNYPGTAKMLGAMADEESGHLHRLLDQGGHHSAGAAALGARRQSGGPAHAASRRHRW